MMLVVINQTKIKNTLNKILYSKEILQDFKKFEHFKSKIIFFNK